MSIFTPSAALRRVTDITAALLHSLGAEALFLDVDNTLALDGSQTPLPGAVAWSEKIREDGFRVIILSNNFSRRVAPFAEQFNLPFRSAAMKPLPAAYWAAARRMGVRRERAVVVGDQVFTDILGANLAGMKSILLQPVREEPSGSFRIRRSLEKSIRRKMAQRTGDETNRAEVEK